MVFARQRRTVRSASGLRPLASIGIVLLSLQVIGQSYQPLGYWQFGQPNRWADYSGNAIPRNVTINPAALTQGNGPEIVGKYHEALDLPPNSNWAGVTHELDSLSAMVEVGLEFWIRLRPGARKGSVNWVDKCQLWIDDQYIEWHVRTLGGIRKLEIPLRGVGAADPYRLMDQQWHHIVAQYSSKTGDQRVYLDGVCPPGWHVNHGVGAPVGDGGVLNFSYAGGVEHLVADLDEFVAWDTVIPPQMVWEHYQAGMAGQHYLFTVQSPVATYPFPGAVEEGEVDPFEFAPGYPSVPLTPVNLFGTYPLPRYHPTDTIRALVPWQSDDPPFHDGVSDLTSNQGGRLIHERLAREWNHYLFGGGTLMAYNYTTTQFGNPDEYMFHALLSMNANPGLPRFIVSNWRQCNDSLLITTRRAGSSILRQAMPDSFYICDAAGIPALDEFNFRRKDISMASTPNHPLMDSLRLDGRVNRMYLDSLLAGLAIKRLEMVGENDEAVGLKDSLFIHQDLSVQADFSGFSPPLSKTYQSERITAMRMAYRGMWLPQLDSTNNVSMSTGPDLMWYDLMGDEGYDRQRAIFRYHDGVRRATPHFYPQAPRFWRHGYGALFGMDQLCNFLDWQLFYGDSIFNPAVSPGFNDGTEDWLTADRDMIRPGQYLGLLKALGSLGADTYATFLYQINALTTSQGNWRTWHMPMAGYAQAVTSRVQPFLHNGAVLHGDTTLTYAGPTPSYFTFSTGNPNDLITARQMNGRPRYLIMASAQRTANPASQAPKAKVARFRFHDDNGATPFPDSMRVEERLQGSTYILDMANPAPVFYQLDRWHEWREPGHWCRDFDFEAEVWDATNASPSIRTERPVPASSGDFSQFTSYVRQSGGSDWVEYRFQPTGTDQSQLYVWLHARATSQLPQGVVVTVDGANAQTISVGTGSWGWHGLTGGGAPGTFSGLSLSEHVLRISQGTAVDVDRIVLMRISTTDTALWGANAEIVTPSQDTTICLGDTMLFSAKVGTTPGCREVDWDFGDGLSTTGGNAALAANGGPSSSNDIVSHLYRFPGDYTVVLTVTSRLTGEQAVDSVHVHVRAPAVDAGPDRVACLGDSAALMGNALPLYHWLPDTALSDTAILNPLALADTSHYFYLNATDSAGCSMTDSAFVTVVGLPWVTEDTLWRCPGDTVHLLVNGAFWVDWQPDSTLDDLHVPNPVASPVQTTTYYFTATDICRCDTVQGHITVMMQGAITPDTTICQGGSVVLQAVGPGPHLWTPGGLVFGDLTVFPTADTTYVLAIDTHFTCHSEVHVEVLPFACCSIPVPTDWVRVRTSTLQPGQLTGGTWRVYDTLFVDNTVSFTNTVFLMQPYAVVSVAPSCTLSTTSCVLKPDCPEMWAGVSVKSATSHWVSRTDYVNGAIRGVWSRNGGSFQLGGSTFQACWTGAFVEGGTAANVRTISACQFLPPGPGFGMLPPFDNQRLPWAGVHLEGTLGFVVGTGPGAPGFGINVFDRLQHGVYSRNAQVTLYNNKLTNMAASTAAATVAPWSLYGLGIGAGVRAVATGNSSVPALNVGHATQTLLQLPQYRNTLVANQVGIHVQGRHAVRSRGNYLTNNALGLRVGAANLSSVVAEFNTHEDDGLAIWVGNGGMLGATNTVGNISENTITGSATAIRNGIRVSLLSFPQSPGYPMQVIHNTINIRGRGIWVETSKRINVEDNRITLAPLPGDSMRGITVTSAPGNKVFNNKVWTNAVGLTTPGVSGIYVAKSGSTLALCNWTYGLGRHIVFEGSCPNSDVRGNIMRSVSGSQTAPAGVSGLVLFGYAAISNQGAPNSPTDNQWIGVFSQGATAVFTATNQTFLYARSGIAFSPTNNYANLGPPVQFLPASGGGINCSVQNISSSKLAAIQDAANAALPTNPIDSAFKYRMDEWAYEAMVDDTALVNANPSIQPYFSMLDSSDLGAASRANLELTVPDTTGAIIQSAQVLPLTTILEYQKAVQGIRVGDDEIDSHELARLLAVASDCEDLGGSAVNIARSMLAAEGIFLWEDPGCGVKVVPPGRKVIGRGISGESPLSAECWPNPTSGRMQVRFSADDARGRLRVVDATGRTLLAQAFDYQGQPLEIDATLWAQGLLLVGVELEDGSIFNWRVVLER